MENKTIEKRAYWIDLAKFLSIIAVMIDHTNGILYLNQQIAYFSYYSVSLFVLMVGVTSYWSYDKHPGNGISWIKNKCWNILQPYLVATFLYVVLIDKQFDFEIFINRIIHFNASGPFYYVFLYIQLILVSPLLYYFFKAVQKTKYSLLLEMLGMIVMLCVSSITTNYSNILGIYGGGGKLIGGSYLILMYLGMWFGKYYHKIDIRGMVATILFFVSLIVTVAWGIFVSVNQCQIDLLIPFGKGINPPSISLGLYAILIAITLWLLAMAVQGTRIMIPIDKFSALGKHTLYIFLYHRLFIDYIIPAIFSRISIEIENVWIKGVVYFTLMIGGSLIIEFILVRIYETVRKAYKEL